MRVTVLLWAGLVSILSGCGSSGKEEILANAPAAELEQEAGYQKPEGVAFHLLAILGMKYPVFKGSEIETYLGERLEETRLPGIRGQSIKYGQGEVFVARDIIYAVAYDFPRPATKLEALHMTGLPESLLAELKPTTTQQRIERSSYGFRRLVLTRTEPGADQYIRIEAWKFIPQERF